MNQKHVDVVTGATDEGRSEAQVQYRAEHKCLCGRIYRTTDIHENMCPYCRQTYEAGRKHEREQGPTQWAYEQVCKARDKWQERTEKAEAALRGLTPGGSELQTVEECRHWIELRLASRAKAEARVRELEKDNACWQKRHDEMFIDLRNEQARVRELEGALKELLEADVADPWVSAGRDESGHPINARGLAKIKARRVLKGE